MDNPSCPKCGHYNAILNGKCRDCDHVTCDHARAKSDLATWKSLKFVGLQDFGFEVLELRNCACGNTLALEVIDGRVVLEVTK